MKKKILAGILTMAMLCTGLAGCGSKNETVDGESKEKKVSITISVPDLMHPIFIRQQRNLQSVPMSIQMEALNLKCLEMALCTVVIQQQVLNSFQQDLYRC